MLSTSAQWLKNRLVKLGPESRLVQSALKFHAARRGFRVAFVGDTIELRKSISKLILARTQYVQVPIMLECFDLYFKTVQTELINGWAVLDFSRPALHRYRKDGMGFYFPSVPEDDVMDAYTQGYTPSPGDVVWDAGAHAGATSYYLSQMVGPTGKVYAFEPDGNNYRYLLRNVETHNLHNVVPVKKALAGNTGTAQFCMDGTMAAGISEYLTYKEEDKFDVVPTLTFADACSELGAVPTFVKMDIEGAEVAVIEGAQEFLKRYPVHFAIESYHRVDGEFTFKPLERLFAKIGYEAWSSNEFGEMFTWARPASK